MGVGVGVNVGGIKDDISDYNVGGTLRRQYSWPISLNCVDGTS